MVWEYGNLPDAGKEDTKELKKKKKRIKENQSGSSDQKATDSRCLYPSCAGHDQNENLLLLSINPSVQMAVEHAVVLKVQSPLNEAK